jgi:hypothetical protein
MTPKTRLSPWQIIAAALALLFVLVSLPTSLNGYLHRAVILPLDKQIFYYRWQKKMDSWFVVCGDIRQHPEVYLKKGEITQQQYQYIKKNGDMSSCDEIMKNIQKWPPPGPH